MKKVFLFLLCAFSIAFTLFFTACGQTPAYFGTYYSLDKNDYITIDSRAYIKDSGSYRYTVNGDNIIINNNRQLKLFNNYTVICLADADYIFTSNNIQCSTRNDYFNGTFSVPNVEYLTFYNDGTVGYLYLPDSYNSWQGTYTINNGIICVYGNFVLTNETIAKYYYLDSSFNLYSMVLCKKGAEYLTDNTNATPNNPTTIEPDQPIEIENNYKLSYSFRSELNGYIVSGITGTYGNVIIPSTYKSIPVVAIGTYAFYGCENLKEITLPDSIKIIYENAFNNCESLEKINIPYGVEEIGRFAFDTCKNLKNIIIPDSVTSIGGNAFTNCSSLESITLSNSIYYISSETFYNCVSLKQITIPESVKTIHERAFANCTSLTNIIIPKSVEYIASGIFSNCTSLTSITIPENVDKYYNSTKSFFGGCINLKTVYIDSPKMLNESLFADNLPDFATDVYILTNLTPTLSVYTIVYEKQDEPVIHDGKEYYHYKIKE